MITSIDPVIRRSCLRADERAVAAMRSIPRDAVFLRCEAPCSSWPVHDLRCPCRMTSRVCP